MKYILLALLLSASAFSQEAKPKTNPVADQKKTAAQRKELLTQIFSQLSTPEFNKAIDHARKSGIPNQILLEARFLHFIDQGDDSALAKLAPELSAMRDQFDLELSHVFGVQEDWLSVIHYTQALAALEKKDTEKFKKHITEAYWLNPRHGQIYAPHIERLRLKHAMASVTLSPDLSLQPQQGGDASTLGALMKGKKAAIFHFWSPMSQESEVHMPDFISTSKECKAHNIAVISVLIGTTPEVLVDAELTRKKHQAHAQCSWITDTFKPALTTTLRITDIPTMVIVSPEGKILFNGHPSENTFWNTVQKIAPKFERPNNSEHQHADD